MYFKFPIFPHEEGSLKDLMLFGIPYELKNISRAKITFLAEVLLINSTSEYFVRWSIIANIQTIREWAQKI